MPEHRELQFDSLDQVIAEIERLASGEFKTTGNHTFAQIVNHLATTLDAASGRKQVTGVPFHMRMMATIFKPLLLSGPVKPGFKLPEDAEKFFWSTEDLSLDEQVAYFHDAMQYFSSLETYPKHPVFGKLNPTKSLKLQCGHCAMHLGFVHPVADS